MKVKNLELKQFRNISNLNLSFNKNINVFVGDNGQGKTNIIESLVYLSSGRSFRVSSDEYLIQYSNEFLSVIADIEDQNNTQNLKVVLSSAGKYLQVNQQPLKKMTEFIGRCNVVLFNPEDINFYSNSPRKRRREIDFELGKMSKRYLNQLSLSNKLLSERNAYLKNKNVDQDYLEILTEKLVDASILIIEMRAKFVHALNPIINHYYHLLSDSKDQIVLHYKAPISLEGDLKGQLLSKMQDSFQRDCDFKVTQNGIHRDDFIFMINDIPVVNVSSQGQKRMLIIAFKLAIVELIFQSRKTYPILCLDDLFSELDNVRRERVLNVLHEEMQVFITTTDLDYVKSKRDKSVFKVVSGNVEEVI